jgi:hypothetical protein
MKTRRLPDHRISRFPAAGRVVVKERVNAIALPPAEDIRRDSELFLEGVRSREFQNQLQAAMKSGFQTRDAELRLAQLLGNLADAGGKENGKFEV